MCGCVCVYVGVVGGTAFFLIKGREKCVFVVDAVEIVDGMAG
jgi:hypothetical protein